MEMRQTMMDVDLIKKEYDEDDDNDDDDWVPLPQRSTSPMPSFERVYSFVNSVVNNATVFNSIQILVKNIIYSSSPCRTRSRH